MFRADPIFTIYKTNPRLFILFIRWEFCDAPLFSIWLVGFALENATFVAHGEVERFEVEKCKRRKW